MTLGAGRPAASAAALIVGTMWSASVFGPVHQVRVPSASSPVALSICGPSAATTMPNGGAPFAVEGQVRAVRLTLVADGLVARQRAQDAQVVAYVTDRLVVAHAEHVLDHHPVAEPDTQGEAALAGRIHREALLRDRRRMSRIGRDHRRAEFDARDLSADDRQHRQRVVAEDVRRPVRSETVGLRLPRLRDDVVDRSVVDGSTEVSDTHALTVATASHRPTTVLAPPAHWVPSTT